MKLKQWLYGAAALAMLAACSDKDIVPDEGGKTPSEGSGFIGVRIQMPTVPSTRANDVFDDGEGSEYKLNDAVLVLFEGTAEANAQCIGAFELKRSQLNADPNDNPQITTQVTRVANITGMTLSESDNLYALVITNAIDNNLLSSDNLFANWMQVTTTATEGGTSTTRGKTIKEFQEYITTNKLFSQEKPGVGYASSIVMTNSPLAPAKNYGGDHDPGSIPSALPVLVKLYNKVYPTEAEAIKAPAGTIHVERAVGKITCSKFEKTTGVTVKVNDVEYKLVVDSVYWDMAQAMTNTYLVRNTNRVPVANQSYNHNPNNNQTGNMWLWSYATTLDLPGTITAPAGKWRMIGHTKITSRETDDEGTKDVDYYRPYFCQVPGYGKGVPVTVTDEAGNPVLGEDGKEKTRPSTTKEDKSFNKTVMDAVDAQVWSDESAFYPRENTFPVEFMKYANTTRIGFWVTFKFISTEDNKTELDLGKTKDIFVRGLDKSILYVRNSYGDDPLTAKVIEDLTNNEKVKKAVEDAMVAEPKTDYSKLYLGDLLDIQYNKATLAKSGEIVITSISFKDLANDEDVIEKYGQLFAKKPTLAGSGYSFANDLERLNNLDLVYVYQGGKVFYEVRIKHFGDDLTPWTAPDQASTINQSYGTATTAIDFSKRNANYLGRYGIVRNNWYDLQVGNITRLGDPQDPAKWDGSWPGKPDDNKDEYIAVILRVLSWAKRTQSVIF